MIDQNRITVILSLWRLFSKANSEGLCHGILKLSILSPREMTASLHILVQINIEQTDFDRF